MPLLWVTKLPTHESGLWQNYIFGVRKISITVVLQYKMYISPNQIINYTVTQNKAVSSSQRFWSGWQKNCDEVKEREKTNIPKMRYKVFSTSWKKPGIFMI